MTQRGQKKAPVLPRPRTIDPVAGLAGSIAHDFSNLLMVIRNAGSLIREALPPEDPNQEYLTELLRASERAMRLTQQLQAIGRSQLLKPDIVRPAEVVRGIRDTLRDIVPRDIDFRVAISTTDAATRFDATQLPVVIMNLVSYAADRIEQRGRIQLAVREEIVEQRRSTPKRLLPAGRYVSIAVARSGPPLDERERRSAFRPELAGKALPRGTDLRLASAYGIVVQSGGFMDLTSDPKHGTTFHIHLPIIEDHGPDTVEVPRPMRVHRDLGGSEVILVVEDDANLRATVRASLEFYGYTVLEAEDGDEALRLTALFNTMPDLLLTDLVMPNVTGRELIEALSLEGRLPKVLMMSGYTDDHVLQRAGPTKSYPFIRKPFTHEELARRVRELFDTER